MKKKSIKGAKGVDPEVIDKLNQDVIYILGKYRQKYLAQEMGQDEGNFSKYLNGIFAVTMDFIDEFYRIWGNELPGQAGAKEERRSYRTITGIIADMVTDIKKDTVHILKVQEGISRLLSDKMNEQVDEETGKTLTDGSEEPGRTAIEPETGREGG